MAPSIRVRIVAVLVLVLVVCTLLAPARALATNATNLLGYSAAAQGMAGAASVSVLDTQLINTNPASLFLLPDSTERPADSVIKGGIGNFTLGVLQPYLHHTDAFGNDREGENNPFIAIQGGLALRFREMPRLTVGLGVPGGDCRGRVGGGVKPGAPGRTTPILTAGVAYTSPGSFHYDNGTANVVFTPAGRASRVGYDASVSGITHPQNVQMGFALKPLPRLLLALDLTWHDWSTFRGFTIKLRHPDTPGAPRQIDLFSREDWRDQFVVALGAAYELIPDFLTVRAGYNYANNPSPAATFSPAIQVPFEHHVTAGAGVKLARHWELDAGFVYAPEKKVTYTNQQLPFDPNA